MKGSIDDLLVCKEASLKPKPGMDKCCQLHTPDIIFLATHKVALVKAKLLMRRDIANCFAANLFRCGLRAGPNIQLHITENRNRFCLDMNHCLVMPVLYLKLLASLWLIRSYLIANT